MIRDERREEEEVQIFISELLLFFYCALPLSYRDAAYTVDPLLLSLASAGAICIESMIVPRL